MKYLKHKKFLDVCIKCHDIVTLNSGALIVYGSWYNLGQLNSYAINLDTSIVIERQNLRDWMFLETDDDTNLRKETWV